MKKQKDGPKFQTHIPEPRWQVVVSVAAVVLWLAFEAFLLLKVF